MAEITDQVKQSVVSSATHDVLSGLLELHCFKLQVMPASLPGRIYHACQAEPQVFVCPACHSVKGKDISNVTRHFQRKPDCLRNTARICIEAGGSAVKDAGSSSQGCAQILLPASVCEGPDLALSPKFWQTPTESQQVQHAGTAAFKDRDDGSDTEQVSLAPLNATTAVRSFVLDLIADDPEILSFSDMWWEKSPSAITEALARRLVQAHFVLVTNEANEGVHFVQSSLLRQRGTASSQQQMQSSLLNATGASQISSEQALLSSEPASSAGQTPCASAVTVSQGAAKKDCLCKHCTGENLVSISGVSDCGPPTSTRFSPSQGSARYLTTVLDRTDPQHATGSAQVQLMTSVCRCSGHVCIALPQISGSYTDSSKNILHVVESVHIAIEAEAMPESRSAENVPLALFLSQQDKPDMPDARPILRRAPHTEVRRDRTFRDWICSFRPVVEASPARDHREVGELNLGQKQHNVTKLAGPYDMPALTKFCRGSGSLSESFGTKFDMERDTYMHVTSGQKGLHSISFSGEPNNPVLLKAVLPDCQALALRVKGGMHVWSLPSTSNLCDAVQKTRCRIHEVMLDNSNMCIHIPAC